MGPLPLLGCAVSLTGPVTTQQPCTRSYGRRGGLLFLHGSRAAGLFRDAADGSPVCVTATLFDGLVLGRSARNHSMNYRSVTIHGSARPVTEPEQIIAGLRAVVDHVTPGRWEQVRKPTPAELRETALWQVAIDNASVKQRSGSTLDPEADRALQVWSGHLPARLTFGQPVPAEGVPPGTELPDYLHALRCHPLADVLSVLAFSRTRLVASWRPLSQEIP
jgi:nitroimidazol reductase NimA-like FMN-containing flavoprotein (pyridoxamine 5'-phosphate oxidase superfamily)